MRQWDGVSLENLGLLFGFNLQKSKYDKHVRIEEEVEKGRWRE